MHPLRISFIMIAITLLCTACSKDFRSFERTGTYVYEGEQFDVYKARREQDESLVWVILPKDAKPASENVFGWCETRFGSEECNKFFGKRVRERRKELGIPATDESDSSH